MSVVLRIVLDGEPGTLLVPESKVTQANMAVLAQNGHANPAWPLSAGIRNPPAYLCEVDNKFCPLFTEILRTMSSSLVTVMWIVMNP